jgi:hypothetical protein
MIMRVLQIWPILTCAFGGVLAGATCSQAAIATWVSGTGSDAGTCPIANPCRTFAYAHSQTSTYGTINVLSPSPNFGPVTITKPISIVAQGVDAVINSTADGAGIIVQAGANAIVSLRGLTIDLRGSDKLGISFLSGAALHIYDCVVRRATEGIRFQPSSGTSELYLTNSSISETGDLGVYVHPTGTAAAKVLLDTVKVENNSNFGIFFVSSNTVGAIKATVRDSFVAGNVYGIGTVGGGGIINLMIDRTTVANNSGGYGIGASAATTISLGDSTISGNTKGLHTDSGGVIESHGTNQVNGNGMNGAPTSSIGMD